MQGGVSLAGRTPSVLATLATSGTKKRATGRRRVCSFFKGFSWSSVCFFFGVLARCTPRFSGAIVEARSEGFGTRRQATRNRCLVLPLRRVSCTSPHGWTVEGWENLHEEGQGWEKIYRDTGRKRKTFVSSPPPHLMCVLLKYA